ncbi:MAG TPA: alpha/beta hydrolase-fold protein [Caulobacteraceae bacterium]|nr:alpha/beta hydrolase-fold protein [Caulobacteraceae bacterium]
MLRLICALIWLALAAHAVAAPLDGVKVVSDGPYHPASVQQIVVHSARLGRDIEVIVSAPAGGPPLPPGGKYPAIYALDGGYGVAGPIAQQMAWSWAMWPAYVISLTYPAGVANARDTDFLFQPTIRNGATIGGGGAAFQAFLTDDLRPFLESRYPLDPARAILFGHSYGGLFAANVLAAAPDSFGGYIIASPSTPADPFVVDRLAAVAARGHGQRVFVAVGGNEGSAMVSGAEQVAAALASPGTGFIVQKQVFAGEGHVTYYPMLVSAAFAWMLPSPPGARSVGTAQVKCAAIQVSNAALDRLVGVYLLSDGRAVTIRRQGASLLAQMTGSPEGEVFPETPQSFCRPDVDVHLRFETAATGAASAVTVDLFGSQMRAVRTERH